MFSTTATTTTTTTGRSISMSTCTQGTQTDGPTTTGPQLHELMELLRQVTGDLVKVSRGECSCRKGVAVVVQESDLPVEQHVAQPAPPSNNISLGDVETDCRVVVSQLSSRLVEMLELSGMTPTPAPAKVSTPPPAKSPTPPPPSPPAKFPTPPPPPAKSPTPSSSSSSSLIYIPPKPRTTPPPPPAPLNTASTITIIPREQPKGRAMKIKKEVKRFSSHGRPLTIPQRLDAAGPCNKKKRQPRTTSRLPNLNKLELPKGRVNKVAWVKKYINGLPATHPAQEDGDDDDNVNLDLTPNSHINMESDDSDGNESFATADDGSAPSIMEL
ncbi:unnamed protein product [Adineta ricciae]|uniref:Uncharacterized protein n=1 Tax=Adineta ricciae TaxID=249248 RepID=A0A814Z4Y7_ADIRI|nr:unnamed protein product [Adineta ricciae]CAF1501985.1 unnamed protein product [Adineta ricciae]